LGGVGVLASFLAIAIWIGRQLKKPFHWWRKRGFIQGAWDPVLDNMDGCIEDTLASDILDPRTEVDIRAGEKAAKRYGKKFTQFVSEDEMKRKELANDSLVAVAKHIVIGRTDRFRRFLPSNLRTATDDITIENIIWDLRPEALEELPDHEDTDDESQVEYSPREKIEQMYLADHLVSFLRTVLETHSGEQPSPRIQKQVGQFFERKFQELQESIRGILVRISKTRLKYYRAGLCSIFIPQRITTPSTYSDWHAFMWEYPEGVVACAPIQGVPCGSFESLWDLYQSTHFRVDGLSQDETYKLASDWIRGLGGKRGKRVKLYAEGTPLHVNLVLLSDIKWKEYPISKDEFKNLTRGRLTDFARLTQKQVVSLLEHGA